MPTQNKRCPICGNYSEHFLPYGSIPRPEAQCPFCGSLERHRLLWIYLHQKTNLFEKTNRVLHFAPEGMFHSVFSQADSIDYWPVDIEPQQYKQFVGETTIRCDITDILFKDTWFDVIFANQVLEHVHNDALAMSELYRVLKPGGWAILQVPLNETQQNTYEDWDMTTDDERTLCFGQRDHVRVYGLDYKDRLQEAGFTVTVDTFVNKFSTSELDHLGIIPNEKIYLCEKK